jgi:hypothetical protein
MSETSTPTCETCEFWDTSPRHGIHLKNEGRCRARPPTIVHAMMGDTSFRVVAVWPVTSPSDWCGAWTKKRQWPFRKGEQWKSELR